MNSYFLPSTLVVGEAEYCIRTDFREILDILEAASDPDMDEWEKQEVMFRIIFPEYANIPPTLYSEACKKASDFIDCNMPEGKPKPRMIDWEQDAPIIIPAINKVAGREVRAETYLHWWTFIGFFLEIEDGLFSQVLSIRQKKAKKKKLEKWEKEFEQNNPELVKLRPIRSKEEQKEIDNLEKWL